MDLAELERRLKVVEDIEAIKQLKNRYCYYCDVNYDADGIESCFVEDAIWEGIGFGTYYGRKAIREFFTKTAPATLHFAMHLVMNPVIEVNGDTAKGRWYIFEPVTFAQGEQAGWLAGAYEDDYVRSGGGWKYKHLRFRPYISTTFDKPWANKRFGPQ